MTVSASRSTLVTGGSGFVGRHVTRRLLRDGHRVTLLQRSDRHRAECEVLQVDDMTAERVRNKLRGRSFDWLIHLAGAGTHPADRDIETLFRINVDVTRALTEVAAGWPARAVFVAGSGSEYAANTARIPLVETAPLEACRLYAASKAAGTSSAIAIACALGLPLVVGRLFGIYGPGEAPHRLLPSLFAQLRKCERAQLSPGTQRRDFLYIDDAVEAILQVLHALEKAPVARIMNIAVGEAVSVRLFAETVADVLGADHSLLGFGDLSARPDDVSFFSGDPSRIFAYTGWKPRFDVRAGITCAVEILKRAQKA